MKNWTFIHSVLVTVFVWFMVALVFDYIKQSNPAPEPRPIWIVDGYRIVNDGNTNIRIIVNEHTE